MSKYLSSDYSFLIKKKQQGVIQCASASVKFFFCLPCPAGTMPFVYSETTKHIGSVSVAGSNNKKNIILRSKCEVLVV